MALWLDEAFDDVQEMMFRRVFVVCLIRIVSIHEIVISLN